MNISFAWTIRRSKWLGVPDPLLEEIKTCTRRKWTDESFYRICKQYDRGSVRHQAFTNVAFVTGCEKLGEIILTTRPYQERLADMPIEDLYHEGNLWETKDEFITACEMRAGDLVVVLRFQFIRKTLAPSDTFGVVPPMENGAFMGGVE